LAVASAAAAATAAACAALALAVASAIARASSASTTPSAYACVVIRVSSSCASMYAFDAALEAADRLARNADESPASQRTTSVPPPTQTTMLPSPFCHSASAALPTVIDSDAVAALRFPLVSRWRICAVYEPGAVLVHV